MSSEKLSPEEPIDQEGQEQESIEPTPEEIGETLKSIFYESVRSSTADRVASFASGLVESPQWQITVPDSDEKQDITLDATKVKYDTTNLLEILNQIAGGYTMDLLSGERDITEIMEDAITVVESLGGDSNTVVDKLIEIGALE